MGNSENIVILVDWVAALLVLEFSKKQHRRNKRHKQCSRFIFYFQQMNNIMQNTTEHNTIIP